MSKYHRHRDLVFCEIVRQVTIIVMETVQLVLSQCKHF